MRVPGDWSVRQVAVAAVLLVLFVAVAAIVPVLIQPGDDGSPAAARPTSAPVTSGPSIVGSPEATLAASPTATATPAPKKTAASFVVHPAVRPRPVTNPPNATYKEFPVECAPARTTEKPPVAGLGPSGTGYDVFGSTETTLAAPGKTPSGATSCSNPGDRSTYWVPQLTQGGRALAPESFQVLYKGVVNDYTSVQPFPAGLRILAGGKGATPSTAPESAVSWACTGYEENQLPTPGTCHDGDRLIAKIASPGCWDGHRLDSPGHRSHLTWAASGGCPASYPVAIPTLLVRVAYPFDVARAVKVSGGAYGFGAVAGWQPKVLGLLVKDCINAGEHCGDDGRPD